MHHGLPLAGQQCGCLAHALQATWCTRSRAYPTFSNNGNVSDTPFCRHSILNCLQVAMQCNPTAWAWYRLMRTVNDTIALGINYCESQATKC